MIKTKKKFFKINDVHIWLCLVLFPDHKYIPYILVALRLMIGQAKFLAEVVNRNGIQVIYKQFYRKGH